MDAADYRICPACGSRNKPKWQDCIRCGEPLDAVALGSADTEVSTAVDAEEQPTFPWSNALWLASLGILAVLAVKAASLPPPARPDPAAFTLPTLPPSRAEAAPTVNPRSAGADSFETGRQLLARGDAAGAAEHLARAVGEDGANPLFRHTYAVALWRSQAMSAAVDQYKTAVQLAPETVAYRLDLAKALVVTGRPDDAVREFQAVVILQPAQTEALEEMGRLLARSGDAAAAAGYLRRAAELRPGDAVLLQALGDALDRSGDADGAAATYARVLEANPQASITRGLLAENLYRQGRADEAVALFRAGLERDPNAPLLHRGLGSLMERMGHPAEAAAAYREYTRLAPNAADASQLAERAARLAEVALTSS